MSAARSAWRARLPLFVVLLVLLTINVVILVGYNLFYEERFKALLATRDDLEKRRGEAEADLAKTKAAKERLDRLREGLAEFKTESLGTRREELAPLLLDVYRLTKEAGLVPGRIAYSEVEIPGAEGLQLMFTVEGRYAAVKKLLALFENSDRFLVVERVAVTVDDVEPDKLGLTMAVANYYQSDERDAKGARVSKTRAPLATRSTGRASPAVSSGGGRR